jgi:hypothetical protein
MKSKYVRIRYMKICFFVVLLLPVLLHAHPGWVQAGVVANYEGVGAFKKDGQYNSGAKMEITERVDSANNGNIVVTTTFREPTSGYTIVNTSSYRPNDILGAFWIDERAIQNVKDGDKIGIFTVKKGPYQDFDGKIWDAVMLEIKDKTEIRLVFEQRTGLLLFQAEVYPNQDVYIYLKSVSVDLSGYTPQPSGGIQPTNPNIGGVGGLPGYGTNGTGLANGTGKDNATGPGWDISNIPCLSSLLFIAAGVYLAFTRGG